MQRESLPSSIGTVLLGGFHEYFQRSFHDYADFWVSNSDVMEVFGLGHADYCSDSLEGGGTIYSNCFFCSDNFDRSIYSS